MELHIREVRKQRGMTMRELGDRVGVSESAIGFYETGKREPSYEILLKIAEELRCNVSDLFFGIKNPATDSGDGQENELNEAVSQASDRQKELIKRVLGFTDEQVAAFLLLTPPTQNNR